MPPIEGPTRADTFEVVVYLQDLTNRNRPLVSLGIWDKRGGGALDSEELKYRPGSMGDEVSLGGRDVNENVTVSRLYRIDRDHVDLRPKLIAGRGKARMEVHQIPLDVYGIADPSMKAAVWKGTLKRISVPEHDSESSDAALVELEMSTDAVQ